MSEVIAKTYVLMKHLERMSGVHNAQALAEICMNRKDESLLSLYDEIRTYRQQSNRLIDHEDLNTWLAVAYVKKNIPLRRISDKGMRMLLDAIYKQYTKPYIGKVLLPDMTVHDDNVIAVIRMRYHEILSYFDDRHHKDTHDYSNMNVHIINFIDRVLFDHILLDYHKYARSYARVFKSKTKVYKHLMIKRNLLAERLSLIPGISNPMAVAVSLLSKNIMLQDESKVYRKHVLKTYLFRVSEVKEPGVIESIIRMVMTTFKPPTDVRSLIRQVVEEITKKYDEERILKIIHKRCNNSRLYLFIMRILCVVLSTRYKFITDTEFNQRWFKQVVSSTITTSDDLFYHDLVLDIRKTIVINYFKQQTLWLSNDDEI